MLKRKPTSLKKPYTEDDIQFIQYHLPILKDGSYSIVLKQSFNSKNKDKLINLSKTPERTQAFTVQGPRFSLNPADIHSIFPPEDSTGEYSNVLPHIVFNRSTLPWERYAELENDTLPWLFLMVFTETEAPLPKVITLKDLGMAPEIGQKPDDRTTVIDVPISLFKKFLLEGAEKKTLPWLSHIRQWYKKESPDGELKIEGELSIVIANRLPKKGKNNVVHLVSLEDRFSSKGFKYETAIQSGGESVLRFVSLKSWRFACMDEKESFKGLLLHLDRSPSTLQMPPEFQKYNSTASPATKEYTQTQLKNGSVPLPHHFRRGGRAVSWYHGPAVTGPVPVPTNSPLPALTADVLLQSHNDYGMLDISYAAAWELGRMLTLANKRVSTALFRWKREHALEVKGARTHLDHLQFAPFTAERQMPQIVADWFCDLAMLKGVPFNYLVADERMLPVEGIRFFWLDPFWIECLLDGAFSIGRGVRGDHALDTKLRQEAGVPTGVLNLETSEHIQSVTGFLLRSDVVSGWPALQVDAYQVKIDTKDILKEQEDEKILCLRMERLSANVLFCLFAGEVRTVDIHPKPEGLHFGVSRWEGEDADETGYYKELRNRSGDEQIAVFTISNPGADLIKKLNSRKLESIDWSAEAGDDMTAEKLARLNSGDLDVEEPGKRWQIMKKEMDGNEELHWDFEIVKENDELKISQSLRVDVPLKDDETRVLDVLALASDLKIGLAQFSDSKIDTPSFTSAEFALEMIEGIQKVRFHIAD